MRVATMNRLRTLHLTTAAALATTLLGVAVPASAQETSMEERLRSQLRLVTGQLQQAQNELAQLKAGGARSPAASSSAPGATGVDSEELQKSLSSSRGQLARERKARERTETELATVRQQAQDAAAQSQAREAQVRDAHQQLLRLANASEAERLRLANAQAGQLAAVQQCEAKNGQLYAVGQEVLRAYETMDMGTVASTRQPFAAQARVKYEQIAQQYADRLYEGKFDVRAVKPPPAAAAGAAGDSFILLPTPAR